MGDAKRDDMAIVLCSGGMDSAVTAALAARSHRLALLHAAYGQRTEGKERSCFEAIADHFEVPATLRLQVHLHLLAEIGGSALTDARLPVPEELSGSRIPVTYVPFRNAHLLASAVSWAEVIGATSIWIGAVEEDGSGYPDCRLAFLEAFGRVIQEGARDGRRLHIEAPLIALNKAEIVRRGLEVDAPLHLTWSCYQDSEKACGRCESCRLRLRGFAHAGVADPIAYANDEPE